MVVGFLVSIHKNIGLSQDMCKGKAQLLLWAFFYCLQLTSSFFFRFYCFELQPQVLYWGERERELLSNCFFYWCPYCVFEMNRSGAKSDKRTAVEVTKDKNRIGQVVLRNPRGASARVRSLNLTSPCILFSFKSSSSNWLNN